MDIYGDLLAQAGQTNDYKLTGSINVQPYIVVSSLSFTYFYWTKALPQKTGTSFKGAQFNSDGTILVTHGYSSTAFIVVFDSATGSVLTSRTYQKSYQNIRQLVKSTVTGAGSNPMTYAFTQMFTSTQCFGLQFFKFNSKTFSTSPQWAKQTIPSKSGQDCYHLGLMFGRTDDHILLYSFYDGKNTLSMMSSAGTWLWGYKFKNGDYNLNNILAFAAIDSSTDMTVATSGSGYIFYSRIVTSSTSPYSLLSGSQTYYDPRYSTNYEIRALRISSLTTAKALIFGYYRGQSLLASINFSTGKVTYKTAFPLMADYWGGNNMQLGIFVSDSLYYVSANGIYFYSQQTYYTNWDYLSSSNFSQSVVYSSVQTTSPTCYTMDTSLPGNPITMSLLTITTLASSPYQNYPTFAFKNDIIAAKTVDLDLTQVKKVSWCTQYPFTVNSVPQTSTFDYVALTSIKQFSINQFSATPFCQYPNTWTYAGINLSNNLPLIAADLITISSTTGQITIDATKPAGTYFIKIVGTLSDGKTTSSATFTLNGGSAGNNYPYFITSPLSDINVGVSGTSITNFPGLKDSDNDVVTISKVIDTNTLKQPACLTFTQTTLTIAPTLITEVGVFNMIVTITDQKIKIDYPFVLQITNQAPQVTGIIPSDLTINFGQEFLYTLPASIDPEGLSYSTTIQSGPSYVQLIQSTQQLTIKPQNCITDIGNKDIYIKLEDEGQQSTVYSITLKVPNRPPLFTGGQLVNQQVMLNTVHEYQLPTFMDPEGCPVTVTFSPNTISSIVFVQGNILIFAPTQPFQVGDFDITVRLTDNQNTFTEGSFNFTVYEPPKFIRAVERQIDLLAGNSATYSLPVNLDAPNQYVKHHSSLPRFVTFSYPNYSFNPLSQQDIGIWTIKGKVWNQYASINFTFKLNLTNQAPYFSVDPPRMFIIATNTEQTLILPKIIDRENQAVSIRTHEANHGELPLFINFNETSLAFNIHPLMKDQPGNYSIDVNLVDSMAASSSYSLIVQVYDPYSFLASKNSGKEVKGKGAKVNMTGKIQNQIAIDVTYIKLNILKVSREHEATLKVQGESELKKEIIKQITNKSFSLTVSNDQINGAYSVQFDIIAKDVSNGLIKVSIKYPNPSNISMFQKPVLLTVLVLRRISFVQKQKQVILLEYTESSGEIPPQITQDIQTKVASMLKGGRITFSQSTPLNIFLGFLAQLIWSRLFDLSFLTINSLISLSIVGMPALIQAVLFKLIYFDILYTELWFPQFMSKLGLNFDSVADDQSVNVFFEENGFQSKQFLKNSGSTFVYIFLYISSWVILLLFKILSRFSSRIEPLQKRLQTLLMWNQTLSFIQSQFNPMILCSLINLYDLRFRDISSTSLVSMVSSFTLLSLLSLALILMFKVTLKGDIESGKYDAITQDLKKSSFIYRPLYLLRWIITLVTILALRECPALQILVLMLLSAMHQAFILRKKPFQLMRQNVITLINEAAVSIYLYFDLLQTDYLESQNIDTTELKVNIAWAMSTLLVTVITINIIYSFSNAFSKAIQSLKRFFSSISKKDEVVAIKPTKIQQFQEFERNQRNINTTVQVTCIDGSRDDIEIISNVTIPQGQKEFMQMFDQRYSNNHLY